MATQTSLYSQWAEEHPKIRALKSCSHGAAVLGTCLSPWWWKWDTGHVWDCGELKKETRSGSEAGSRKNFASTVAWMVVGSDRLLLFLMGTGLAAPWHLPVREGLIAPSLSAVQAKNILPWSSENIPDAFLLSSFLIINAQDESAAFLVDIHFVKE